MEYIYALKDPRTNVIRYIGKTRNPRARYAEHLNDGKLHRDRRAYEDGNYIYVPTLKAAWVCRLLELGLLPKMEIIESVSGNEVFIRECYWIDHYGLAPSGQLYNAGRVNMWRRDRVPKKVIREMVLNRWESL